MSEYPTPSAQIEAISQLGINLLQELFKNKLEDLFPFHLQATCNVQSVCRSERDGSCLYPGSFRMPGIFLKAQSWPQQLGMQRDVFQKVLTHG